MRNIKDRGVKCSLRLATICKCLSWIPVKIVHSIPCSLGHRER